MFQKDYFISLFWGENAEQKWEKIIQQIFGISGVDNTF